MASCRLEADNTDHLGSKDGLGCRGSRVEVGLGDFRIEGLVWGWLCGRSGLWGLGRGGGRKFRCFQRDGDGGGGGRLKPVRRVFNVLKSLGFRPLVSKGDVGSGLLPRPSVLNRALSRQPAV